MSENRTWIADLGNGRYRNPILYTDYSDPDAIRVGDDYFMIASSFCNSPAIPLLHSKDMVNWKVVNYVCEHVPEPRYVDPIHGCGVWAPAIRYHEGEYYVFFPMPDEGIYMTKTKDPYGKWSEPVNVRPGAGWIDPCPFWDEDGKVYLVAGVARSRIGYKSVLHMVEMNKEATKVIGEEVKIFDGNLNDQVTIEGPKMYKRNGYYYIFAPAGGVKTGWQTVLRSKNVYGPYEYKVVMRQGDTPINGPHQGAWVDTQTGEDWFLHFQDVYAAGRIIHLQPMSWVNDWPVIGISKDGNEYGEPVLEYKKPDVGAVYDIEAPEASDDFTQDTLGLQWQWNANVDYAWYKMHPEKSSIELMAVAKEPERSISDVRNLLLQKWCLPEFKAYTKLDVSGMGVGNIAGMVSMGMRYGAVCVKKTDKGMKIVTISGEQEFVNEKANAKDIVTEIEDFDGSEIYFMNTVERIPSVEENVPLEEIGLWYSLDGANYKKALSFNALAGRWVGVKNGIFCCNEGDGTEGSVMADYFNIQ